MYVECDWPENSEHLDFTVSAYGQAHLYFLRDEASSHNKADILR